MPDLDGPAAVAAPAYHSEMTTVSSSASALKFDVFDADNYTSFASTQHASSGVTFTSTDGRFTVAEAGVYRMSVTWVADISFTADVDFSIEQNASQVYVATLNINNNAAPISHKADVILDVAAGDFLNVFVDSSTTSNVTSVKGTAVVLSRVG